ALAQFLDDATGALHIDLAGHLYGVVSVNAASVAHLATKRISFGVSAGPGRTAWIAGTHALPHLLLHRLRHALRAFAHGLERATLRIDGAVGITLAERTLRVAHCLAGATELIALALLVTLLTLAWLREALLFQFLQELVELLTQRLLVLAQLAHL